MNAVRPMVGEPAPPFSGECSDGITRSLETYRDQILILVFHRHLG